MLHLLLSLDFGTESCKQIFYKVGKSCQYVLICSLCKLLLDVMNSQLNPKYVPLPDERKNVEVTRRLADTSKAAALIGFRANIPLREGLQTLVRWLDSSL